MIIKPTHIEPVRGYNLRVDDTGTIVEFLCGNDLDTEISVRLGDIVESNGRYTELGKKGVVYRIVRPGQLGTSSNVICVRWFDGNENMLKLKDIVLPVKRFWK